MKTHNVILQLLFMCGCLAAMAAKTTDQPAVLLKQEIRYTCKGAREVFLVWGINNWQVADSAARPAGTVLRDGLLYTPMRMEAGAFSAVLNLKRNTLVDYKFWITKGMREYATDLWDGAKPGDTASARNDRHTLCMQDNIVLVESPLTATPATGLSILDFSGRILAGALLLLIASLILKFTRYKNRNIRPDPYTLIIGSALVLFMVLLLARASVLQISWDVYLHPVHTAPKLFWSGIYDALYISVLAVVFLALAFSFRKQETTQYALSYSFVALSLASALAGLLNIRMRELQYAPYNFHQLYYNEFLDHAFKKKELASSFTSGYIADLAMICTATFVSILLLGFFTTLFLRKIRIPKLLFTLLCCLSVGYLVTGKKEIQAQNAAYDQLANPVTEFLFSVNPFVDHPQLFTMPVPDSLKKFPRQAESTLAPRYTALPGKIKNVLIVLLGSVGSAYTEPYDSIYKATPHIADCLQHAIVFRNLYAHEPFAGSSLVSLLGSIQPWLSTASLASEHPELELPSLSSELKRKGYRTAFFSSGDNTAEGIAEFLKHRDLEVIKDSRRISCKQNYCGQKNSDMCTEKELVSWLRIAPANPFFAIITTKQTEQPFCFPEAKPYRTRDTFLSKYLNALNATDAMIGKLTDDLKHNRLLESTLLVLVSDKGGTFSIAAGKLQNGDIHEENVHVPCLFVNPFLKQESIYSTGALSDLAPTIMDVLGYDSSPVWQGSSMLTDAPEHSVYFFSPLNGYKFGYREGCRKYLYNAGGNRTEIYDLSVDPYETNNLADEQPEAVRTCHLRLAAWAQRQKAFMDARIKVPPLLASVH